MYTKSIVFAVFLLSASTTNAQLTNTKDSLYRVAVVSEQIKSAYTQIKSGNSGKFKKYRDEIYDEGRDAQIALFSGKEIAADKASQKYLQDIMDVLYKASGATLGSPKVFLSKSPVPNAFTTVDGTIVMNAGLFARLGSEDELAFVLAHELSHHVNRHGKTEMDKFLDHYFSDEFQKQLKNLTKQEYNRNKEVQELEKATMFNTRRHARGKESEADADALVWLAKAGFNPNAAVSAMRLLDGIEDDVIPTESLLKQYFNDVSYPFKEAWAAEKKAFFGGASMKDVNKKEQDSLKTHPDCKKRLAVIQQSLTTMRIAAGEHTLNPSLFATLKKDMPQAILEYCLATDKLSDAVYTSFWCLQNQHNQEQALLAIGKSFNKIFKAQKEHTLSKYIDLPSPYAAKDYNALLKFFERIDLQEIAAINYYFLKKQADKYKGNPQIATELAVATTNFNASK